MKRFVILIVILTGFLGLHAQSFDVSAQTTTPGDSLKGAPANWFNLDFTVDKVRGMSTEKAYAELLKDKTSKPVIVAIIDGGTDILHPDLQENIWINEDEIPGNQIDDDQNGYVDDINGWNFIGGKNGENVDQDALELTRIYAPLSEKFYRKTKAEIAPEEQDEYKEYLKLRAEYESELELAKSNYEVIVKIKELMPIVIANTERIMGKSDYTLEELKGKEADNELNQQMIDLMIFIKENDLEGEGIDEVIKQFEDRVNYHLNLDFNPRYIVGDDYENIEDRFYGNNDVIGPDSEHGTHVAGIIGAVRDNETGINGIASNVKLMIIRAVPNGDERDKDVANAIRYAADNGARVVNMSFGKEFTAHKGWVDDAVRYAMQKNVLLVHAAGNDAKNNDKKPTYPNPYFLNSEEVATNWLEVGASSWKDDFVGVFSNYGKKTVDVFAPGVDIMSTTPDQKYKALDGTSMAAPMVSGLAALILSYYPELTAPALKEVIVNSCQLYANETVSLPSDSEKTKKTKFGKLSKTGGIVNVPNALKIAGEKSPAVK